MVKGWSEMTYISELTSICNKFGCCTFLNAPLKNYTTFKVGGNCKLLISINSVETLQEVLKYLIKNEINYDVIGKGSNIIASDNGFDGVIILFGKDFSEVKMTSENTIECQSGASLKSVCCVALENNMSGLEFAWGIPGTIGGGLYMNAGAYGGEISNVVLYAEYVNENGELIKIEKKDMDLAYRRSIFSDNRNMIIVKVVLELVKNEYNNIKLKMDELLKKRIDKQPLNFPSAGSTFKRPDNSYASFLIEQCGLKGESVGDAQVSEKHSGFIINKGNATCDDIMKLVSLVQEKVKDDTGYELELEPRIIK